MSRSWRGSTPPMVGRERELAALRAAWQAAISGRGGLTLVAGEEGIGKTTLVNRVVDETRAQGALVLTGRGYDLETTPPYGPWREMMTGSAPSGDFPPPPAALIDQPGESPVTGAEELRAAVGRYLADVAARSPVALLLDDAHWADPASLDLARYVARHLAGHAVLFIVTYRDTELREGDHLYRLLPHLVRESRPLRIGLRPLAAMAVATLVQERYGLSVGDAARLVDYLDRTTEGNPFFIDELLAALEDDQVVRRHGDAWSLGDLDDVPVPLLVRQVIDGRLERASQRTRQLLRVAAVIGAVVPIARWREVVDVPEEVFAAAIEEAIAVQALTETADAGVLRFRHALIQQALVEGLPLPRRNAWHRRVGEVLAGRPRIDPDGPAYHLWRANDQRAVPWLIRAGDRALALYAPVAAVDHYSRAIDLSATYGITVPIETRRARGRAYATLGDFDAALADQTVALDAARAANERRAEWQALIDLGKLWNGRDYARVGAFFEQALALAQDLGDRALVAHSLVGIGNWHVNVGRSDQAVRRHERALAEFEALGDRQGIAETADMLGLDSLIRGDMVQAAAYARRATAVATALHDQELLASALALLVGSAGVFEFAAEIPAALHSAETRQAGEQVIALASGMTWRAEEAFARSSLASHVGMRGDYRAALALAERALASAQEIAHREWVSLSGVVLGEIMLDLLAWDEAERYLAAALEPAVAVGSFVHLRLAAAPLARAIAAGGDSSRASAVLAPVLGDLDAIETSVERSCWRARADVALAAGDPETALRIADRLIATTANGSAEQIAPALACPRAEALLALGRPAEAEQTLLAAERIAARFGLRPARWRIARLLGEALHRQDRSHDGRQAWTTRRQIVEKLADTIPDTRLREQFRNRATSGAGTLPVGNAAGISAREIEVLRLAARGLTNDEIASQLFISNRTVKGHLQSIYGKLGVNSRTAATAAAFEQGLV